MMKTGFMLFALGMVTGQAAQAADCGEPPVNYPSIPNGEEAQAEQIRQARDAVVSFSNRVDAYIACMDQRAQVILPYMTKEQRLRWDEDLADLHNKRRDLQMEMNVAIRSYRDTNE